VDLATHNVADLIANAKGGPASRINDGAGLLERPVAAKFAPDGSLYIVDFGKLTVKSDGRRKVTAMTGRILRLRAGGSPTSSPSATATRPSGNR
jgi:hypothetical protein